MNEIRRVLRTAAWRLFVLDFFRTLTVTSTAAIVALIGVLLAERIFGVAVTWPDVWVRLFAIAAGLAIVAAVLWSALRRASTNGVARELDERANLRESLSTALCVSRIEDPWAKVVVETAREKAVGVRVNQAIPYVAPKIWPAPFATALAMAILWFSVPNWDVLGLLSKRQTADAQKEEIKTVANEVKANEEKLKELLEKAKVDFKNEEAAKPDAADSNKPLSPDEIRRAAVKKLTSMTEKLGEMKSSDKAKQMESLKQMMKQLKQPGPGPLDNLTKSLQQGNFAKAQQDLEELSKQMANNNLSKEDKEKAAEQMKKLGEQLQKMAQATEDMQKKLEQAGMSKEQAKQAAANPQAMKEAMDQLKNMSESEKQELMKQLQAKMNAAKQCNNMSEAMSQMSKGSGKNGMNQQAQKGAESMSGQLSDMEMAAKDMEGLDAAMEEAMAQLSKMGGNCKGGNCNGDGELAYGECESPWKAGDTSKKGKGRGGPGQSGGSGKGAEEEAPVSIEKTKVASKMGQGPIIGSRLVYGDQIRGESVAEFSSVVESASKAATDPIVVQQIPPELRDSVKHYFGRLDSKAKAQQQPAAEKK